MEGHRGLENIRGKRINTKDGQRESDVLCEGRRQLYKQSTLNWAMAHSLHNNKIE